MADDFDGSGRRIHEKNGIFLGSFDGVDDCSGGVE